MQLIRAGAANESFQDSQDKVYPISISVKTHSGCSCDANELILRAFSALHQHENGIKLKMLVNTQKITQAAAVETIKASELLS